MELISLLSDFTIRNVVLGAALLGITSGVLGSFAVLRQQSLLGDTLSHAALPGVCLGFLIAGSRQLLPIMLGALISGALAAATMLLLTKRSRLKTDAALGIVLSIFFALGIVLLTYINHQNNAGQAGLNSFLFGQAAAILPSDIIIMAIVTGISLLLVFAFWKEFKLLSFDSGFVTSLGFPVGALELVMTIMIALAIVIGLQMVGVILMASMVIAPAVAARQWVKNLEMMVFLAAIFGSLSGMIGVLISAMGKGLATGPIIVVCVSALVGLSLLVAPRRGILWVALQRRRNHNTLRQNQVLVDLYKLAVKHNNPNYPSELGMLSSYYGFSAQRVLRDLEKRKLTQKITHMPEEGLHYMLTTRGYTEAQKVLKTFAQST